LADFNTSNFNRDTEFIENIPYFPNITPTTFPVKALKANYYAYKGESKKALEIINKSQSSNLGFKEIIKSRIFLNLNQVDSSYFYSKLALDKLPNNALHFLIFSGNAAARKDTSELRKRYGNIKRPQDTLQPVFYIKSLMNSGATFNDKEIELAERIFKKTQDNMIKNLVIELKYGKTKKQYVDSLYLKAEQQFQAKNFNDAISNYETILNTIGFEEYAVFENLGLAYHLNKQHKKAIEKFDIVIDSFNIKTGNSELYKALSLYDLKEISEACDLLYQSEIMGNKKARSLRQSLCK
jgi:tetratricopeptide (TPR) repeat protein